MLEILQEFSPRVIALQETKVETGINMNINGFDQIYRKDRNNHGGGVCIAIHNSIPSHGIDLNTNLEIVACRIMLKNFKLTICNVYFNNNADITTNTLDVIKNLPSPVLILGDINGKHPTWGSNHSDSRGDIVNDWALDNEFFTINDGSPTRYNIYNNSYSHIDISMINVSHSDQFKWKTVTNRLVSDHFPIILEYGYEELYISKLPRWIMDKANWGEYRNNTVLPKDMTNLKNPCTTITNILVNSATINIPKSKSMINTKYSNCWWNDDCDIASKNAKKPFNKIKKYNTPEDIEIYLELEETAKTTLLNSKTNSWNSYISTITRTTSIKEI